MPLTYNKVKGQNPDDIIQKVRDEFFNNPVVKALKSPNGNLEGEIVNETIGMARDYLRPMMEREQADTAANKVEAATKLYYWLGNLEKLLTHIATYEYPRDAEEKEYAFDKVMEYMGTVGSERNSINQKLSAFYDKYGYTLYSKPIINAVAGMGQAALNSAHILRTEERRISMEDCGAKVDAVKATQSEVANRCGKFFKECFEGLGVLAKDPDLTTKINEWQETYDRHSAEIEHIKAQIQAAKIANKAASDKLDALDLQLKAFGIDEKYAEFDRLDKLTSEMDSKFKIDMVSSEMKMKSDMVMFGEFVEHDDNLAHYMKTLKGRVDQYEESKKRLDELQKNKENSKLIGQFTALQDRCSKLEFAWKEMNDLLQTGEDIGGLLAVYNNNPDSPMLNDKTRTLVTKYIHAREDIIANYNTSKENRETTRATFQRMEGDQNLMAGIVGGLGTAFFGTLMNLKGDLDNFEKNPVIDKYKSYVDVMITNGDSVELYREKMAEQKSIHLDAHKLKDDFLAQNKNIEELRKKIAQHLKLTEENVKDMAYADLRKLVTAEKQNLKAQIETTQTSVEYKKVLDEIKATQDKYEQTLPKPLTDKLKAAEDVLKQDKARVDFAKPFKDKFEALKADAQLAKEAAENAKIELSIQLDGEDAHDRIRKQLEDFEKRIMEKSPAPERQHNSEHFTDLMTALANAKNAFINNEETPENRNASLTALGNAANKYLYEKGRQWRPWPFASEQRFARLTTARNILNFCPRTENGQPIKGTADKMLEGYSPRELEVQNFVRGKVKFNYDAALEQGIKSMDVSKLQAGNIDASIAKQNGKAPVEINGLGRV